MVLEIHGGPPSPYSYVDDVTTPTLIIHSEYDHRTRMQDAEMWFRALEMTASPAPSPV